MSDREVALRDQRGSDYSHSETARRTPEGGVVVAGQDLGAGVASVFGAGNTEYEWASSIAPSAVPAAVAALGGQPGEDLLDIMQAWATAGRGPEVARTLTEAGVPMELWNRIGD